MNKYLISALFLLLLTPSSLLAHSDSSETTSSGMMMHQIEDRILGEEEHEEHEKLMQKMMSGEALSESEVQEMIEFMGENPGVHSMMMNRLDGEKYFGHMNSTLGTKNYRSHMSFGTYAWAHWITMFLIWGLLGLAIASLVKHLAKK